MNRAMVNMNIRLYGLVLAVVWTWDALVSVTMGQGSARANGRDTAACVNVL